MQVEQFGDGADQLAVVAAGLTQITQPIGWWQLERGVEQLANALGAIVSHGFGCRLCDRVHNVAHGLS